MNAPLMPLPPPGPADRLRRRLWRLVWALTCRFTPVPLLGWRRLVLRLFGARIGAGAWIYPSARIWAPWNLTLERDARIGPGAEVYNVAPVVIGAGAVVSQDACLCTASHDFDRPGFALTTAAITLGEGCWVAAGAFVGPGVSIGARAVALARAVVVRDLPPGVVAGGNPARILRMRGRARLVRGIAAE